MRSRPESRTAAMPSARSPTPPAPSRGSSGVRTMTQITLAVLALGCATLCVGVAGLLRRITDVKLAFGGYTGEVRQFMIDSGRRLPEDVIAEIPDPEDDALLVLGSGSCE